MNLHDDTPVPAITPPTPTELEARNASLQARVNELDASLYHTGLERDRALSDIATACAARDTAEAGAAAMREAAQRYYDATRAHNDHLTECGECPGWWLSNEGRQCRSGKALQNAASDAARLLKDVLQSTPGRALLERLERAERRVRELAVLEEESCQIVDLLGCGEDPVVEAVERVVRERDELKSGYARLDRIATQLQRAVDTEIANVRRMGDLSRKHEAERDAARAELAALRAVPEGTEAILGSEIAHWQQIADSYQNTAPECVNAVSAARLASWLRDLARLRAATVRHREALDEIATLASDWDANGPVTEGRFGTLKELAVDALRQFPALRLATHVSERVRASVEADDTATPLLAGPGAIIPEMREIGEDYCGAGDDGWVCSAKAGHTEPMHAAYGRRTDSPLHVWPVASPTRYPADLSVPTLQEAATVAAAALIPSTPSESLRADVRRIHAARYGTRQAPVFVGPRQDMAVGARVPRQNECGLCLSEPCRMGCEHGPVIQPDANAIIPTTAQETTR